MITRQWTPFLNLNGELNLDNIQKLHAREIGDGVYVLATPARYKVREFFSPRLSDDQRDCVLSVMAITPQRTFFIESPSQDLIDAYLDRHLRLYGCSDGSETDLLNTRLVTRFWGGLCVGVPDEIRFDSYDPGVWGGPVVSFYAPWPLPNVRFRVSANNLQEHHVCTQ